MSLYGMMRTGVSGMEAQANRLSATADNIANSSTAGYKRASTQFSSLVIPGSTGNYNSGGVTTTTRHAVSENGILQYTTSSTDLAVDGDGFFVVADTNGTPYLTRSGNFVPDADGHLVNAAGYTLLGYSYANGTPSATANGFAGLEPVTISQTGLTATPSTTGDFYANLPNDADIVANADLPGQNPTTGATYTAKSSIVTYDNAGAEQLLHQEARDVEMLAGLALGETDVGGCGFVERHYLCRRFRADFIVPAGDRRPDGGADIPGIGA